MESEKLYNLSILGKSQEKNKNMFQTFSRVKRSDWNGSWFAAFFTKRNQRPFSSVISTILKIFNTKHVETMDL